MSKARDRSGAASGSGKDPAAIVAAVREAGVVGAGGAGFPTHVKLSASAEIVIANGTECEPLLQADQHTMAEKAKEILEGMGLAMQATGAAEGIVAIKRSYSAAIKALERHLPRFPEIRLHLFESFYPAGDEFIVVYDCTGRQVPEGGLPIEVGVVVQNVTTLLQISEAMKGRPVTHRCLTVCGEVEGPTTLIVPVGTSFAEVIELAGGYRQRRLAPRDPEELVLISGGPMMGRVVTPEQVVRKTTSGLLVLPRDGPVARHLTRSIDSAVRRGRSTCDQCRDCTDLCPRHLLGHELQPHEVMRSINYGLDSQPRTVTAAVLCCECRVCEAFACPLDLSPVAYYKAIKAALREEGWKNDVHRRKDLTAHSMREFRRLPVSRLIDRLGLAPYRDDSADLDRRKHRPARVDLPLRMHIGAPAEPVVKAGDRVSLGELIARIPEDALGANLHASIDGVVRKVDRERIRIERSL